MKAYVLLLTFLLPAAAMAQKITPDTVGIGTTSPTEKLHIENGNIYLNSGVWINGWLHNYFYWPGHSLIMGARPGVNRHVAIELKPGGSDQVPLSALLKLYSAPETDSHLLKIQFHTDGVSFINGGNVGIGTTNPGTYKLAVEGTIGARKVKVTQSAWADFVFHPDYQLPPLYEIENYIKANRHLPGIPTAAEVGKEGLDLGEMDKKLLQKIEEQTLYLIELSKRIDTLQHKNALLQEQLSTLSNKLKK